MGPEGSCGFCNASVSARFMLFSQLRKLNCLNYLSSAYALLPPLTSADSYPTVCGLGDRNLGGFSRQYRAWESFFGRAIWRTGIKALFLENLTFQTRETVLKLLFEPS